jgi:hypothetical protein
LYLLKFVQADRARGVNVHAITVQNEPQNRTPSGYHLSRLPPVATGTGSGQITTVSLDRRPVRYVRVMLTASSSSWWSVADVRA